MRKTIVQTGMIMLLSVSVIQAQEKIDTAMMRKIREEEMANSQIKTIAHNLTDVAGPRLTNSPGYKRAVSWAVETLKQWGLQHATAEPWGEFGKGWSTERSYIALKEPYYSPMIAFPIAWTNGTNGPVTASVIMLDKLDSATIDAHTGDIKGKVVIVKSAEISNPASFKPAAERYSDSALANIKDMYMLDRKRLDFYVPIIHRKYNTQRYLQTKGSILAIPGICS